MWSSQIDWKEVREWSRRAIRTIHEVADIACLAEGINFTGKWDYGGIDDALNSTAHIVIWFPHTSDRRAFTIDCLLCRNEVLTKKEIKLAERFVDTITKSIPGATWHRARMNALHDVRAGQKGYLFFKICPCPLPKVVHKKRKPKCASQ
jgi:hypothetical protein